MTIPFDYDRARGEAFERGPRDWVIAGALAITLEAEHGFREAARAFDAAFARMERREVRHGRRTLFVESLSRILVASLLVSPAWIVLVAVIGAAGWRVRTITAPSPSGYTIHLDEREERRWRYAHQGDTITPDDPVCEGARVAWSAPDRTPLPADQWVTVYRVDAPKWDCRSVAEFDEPQEIEAPDGFDRFRTSFMIIGNRSRWFVDTPGGGHGAVLNVVPLGAMSLSGCADDPICGYKAVTEATVRILVQRDRAELQIRTPRRGAKYRRVTP